MTTPDPHLRIATSDDIPAIAASLAAAFQNDPIMTWIFPEPLNRSRRIPALFARLFQEATDHHGPCFVAGAAEAATYWHPPTKVAPSLLAKLPGLLPWLRIAGAALPRALIFSEQSDAHRPTEPHWYLHIAGCAPASQGTGLGRAVIRAGLALADKDRKPVYLETSLEKNVGYYRSLGFAVTQEWMLGRRVKCWSMLRPAGPPIG